MNKRRLLKLADKLDALKYRKNNKERGYFQEYFTHDCGTPACALGHWAAWNPRRWSLSNYIGLPSLNGTHVHGRQAAMVEFDLTEDQVIELFSSTGCGEAKTAKQAARYIRKFVERNQ